MREKLPLAFYLATPDEPVTPGDDTWQRPLPLSRQPVSAAPPATGEKTVTYGDYFTAIAGFLEKDQYRTVKTALADTWGSDIDLKQVRNLAVYLVKHGAFYHPARVEVATGRELTPFVVNVAVSPTGRDRIRREYKLLERLCRELEQPVLPRVYALEEIACPGGPKLPMFSGQWFDGFFEFHLTESQPEGLSNVIVWDPDNPPFHLTEKQAENAFRRVAALLTGTYNFFTFEQIRDWHHAAGDFILRPEDADRVAVRLITVRDYAPHIAEAEPDPAALIEGLLLFFLNLTIRNRIDRLDGTGALAWADDYTLRGTIEGFFEGLEMVVRKLDLPSTFPAEFKNYILAHPPEALHELFSALAARIPDTSPEHNFVKNKTDRHAALLRTFLVSIQTPGQPRMDTR